jgi:hypothetical protein
VKAHAVKKEDKRKTTGAARKEEKEMANQEECGFEELEVSV